jgi:23S rRNA pseudouridine2605 synthase
MRLQRALARAGVASRRAAEELIRADKVRVNGQVAHLGMSVDPESDTITVQGRPVTQAKTVWIALHKPLGYVVTRHDPEGRETVFRLVPDVPGLTYVGRLDVMTTGLLLLTNDGGAAHQLMHPRFEVERTYRVVVHGRSEAEIRAAFAKGILIDGREVNVVTLKIRPAEGSRGSLELLLVLAEGRYRIVRRICEQLGLKVERLARLSYGPVRLGDMAPGTWRYLSKPEIASIDRGVKKLAGGGVERRNGGAKDNNGAMDGWSDVAKTRGRQADRPRRGATTTGRSAERRGGLKKPGGSKARHGQPSRAKRPGGSDRRSVRPTRRKGGD